MNKLSRYIRPHAWYIVLTLAIKFLATVMELFIPRLMETILDDSIPQAQLTGNATTIYLLGGGMLLSQCAIWRGDLLLWKEAKRHIFEEKHLVKQMFFNIYGNFK